MGKKVTVNENSELLVIAQNTVFNMIANHAPLKEVFTTIIKSLDQLFQGGHSALHLVNTTEHGVRDGLTIDLPIGIISSMNRAILLCEASSFTEHDIVSVHNLQESREVEEFQEIARCNGYKTCWAKQIPSGLGVITVFHFDEKSPTSHEIEVIKLFSYLAGLAIERKRNTINEEINSLVENNISDLINVIDPYGKILYASPSHLPVLGFHPDEIIGKQATRFLHADDQEGMEQYLYKVQNENSTLITECKVQKKDGSFIIFESRGVLVTNDEDRSMDKVVIVSRDITSRKDAEESMRFMAYHDPLTSLPNRRKLREKMEKLLEVSKKENSSFCILFVDLDNFKVVNDQYGHEIGDLVLVKIAERLKKCLTEDYFIARWGGDEFAIIARLADKVEAKAMAEVLLEEMNRPFDQDCCHVTITPSIGISMYPRDGHDLKTLFEKADKAMYRAKDTGKNSAHTYQI